MADGFDLNWILIDEVILQGKGSYILFAGQNNEDIV
jgi:hypothetical protein